MNPQTTTQPDLQALALTKAIRANEGGTNYNAVGDAGTSTGAYQYQPSTWANYAGQILGDSKAPMTPENQNAVTYGMIKTWKDQGLGPAQIAGRWNHGSDNWQNTIGTTNINGKTISYNTPQYVKDVVSKFKEIYPQVAQQYGGQTQQTQAPEAPSVGGFVQNAFSSAGNLLGGIGNAIMHPIDTISGLASLAGGAVESGTNALGFTDIHNQDTQTFNNIVDYFGKRYGGKDIGEIVHNIGHTLYTDPAGAALDLSAFLDAGASIVGKVGKISDIAEATKLANASDYISTLSGTLKGGTPEAIKALQTPGTLSKTADAMRTIADYTNPITPVVKATTGLASGAAKALGFTAGKIIGEDPAVIADLVKNPQDYSRAAIETSSRGGLAEEFGNAIDQIQQTKELTGEAYKPIRDLKLSVEISDEAIKQAFEKNGLQASRNAAGKWEIAVPTADTTLSPADVAHYKSFLNQFGDKTLNPNQILNARAKLSEFANYEGKSNAASQLGKDLRGAYDKIAKDKIPGLSQVDAEMSPQLQEWKQIKKDFLTRDASTGEWALKPGTANKLANALGKGKESLISKLEDIMPGITRKIEVLKNIEHIENAMGIKVGSYTKSGLEIGGIVTGNIPLAVGMIIAHPSIANQILRAFGYVSKATVIPVLARVRALLGLLPKNLINDTFKAGVAINNANQPNYGVQQPVKQ